MRAYHRFVHDTTEMAKQDALLKRYQTEAGNIITQVRKAVNEALTRP